MSRAATSHEPRSPRINGVQQMARDELLADLDWQGVLVVDDLSQCELAQLSAQGVRCTSATFIGADLQQARIIDTTFEGCDLSGARLDDGAFTRVEFRDCRLSGVQFNASRINDLRFVGCRLDGASFRMAQGERVWFDQCVLTEAEFTATELTRARFDHCDLTAADFSQARIGDASLLGSVVEGIRGVGGLQRPIIDPTQVVPLAYSLLAVHGVVIRAEGDDQ